MDKFDKYIGIKKPKNRRKWMVCFEHNKRRYYFGMFLSLKSAVDIADQKILEVRGAGAQTNADLIKMGILPVPPSDNEDSKIDDLLGEIWKDIPDFEGYYRISNKGRIRSLPRKINHNYSGELTINEKILKPRRASSGHLNISLCKNELEKRIGVHRLVMETFSPHKGGAILEVHHKDFDPSNNRLENLEWVTQKQNINYSLVAGRYDNAMKKQSKHLLELTKIGKHQFQNLTEEQKEKRLETREKTYKKENNFFYQKRGEKAYSSKFKEEDIFKIRDLYSSGQYFNSDLAKMFNTTTSNIYSIVNRNTWKHI